MRRPRMWDEGWHGAAFSYTQKLGELHDVSKAWTDRRFDPGSRGGERLVYFAAKEGLVKIGISYDVLHRVYVQLAADLLFAEGGGYAREQELHALFSHLRVAPPSHFGGKTEWFENRDELSAYIAGQEIRRRVPFDDLLVAA